MSSSLYIQDSLTRHQVFINRYAGGLTKEIESLLRDYVRLLNKRIRDYDKLNLPVSSIIAIRRQVRVLLAEARIDQQFNLNLAQLAAHEVEYMEKLLLTGTAATEIPLLIPEVVYATVTKIPVHLTSSTGKVTRKTIGELISDFSVRTANSITREIQFGLIQGDSIDDITKRISTLTGTRTRREAEALVRTVVNHVGTQARQRVLETNSSIISGERFVATLDSRTTFICIKYDGKIFKIGSGPYPPLHFNCRSTRAPVVDPVFNLGGLKGQRPQKGAEGPGTTSGRTTYQSFLKRQPDWFQDEVLGPERAKLFRSGRVTVDQFVDINGKTLTLDELRELDRRTVI